MTCRIAVVCEAKADFLTGTELAQRVLQQEIYWLNPFEPYVEWVSRTPEGEWLGWIPMNLLAKKYGIRSHGHFDGSPGCDDAAIARRAILLIRELYEDVQAILFLRDQDKYPDRLAGIQQARDTLKHPLSIVIGLAIPERESWVIAGFEPGNDAETTAFDEIQRELGPDPRTNGHTLGSGKDHHKRNAKRVLDALCNRDPERERRCWMETPLATLRQRGTTIGLTNYLDEVLDRLVPLMGT
jgi:hypothetical protein